MSDSEPRRARHALIEEPVETGDSEAQTTALPSGAALFAEHPGSAPDSPSEEYTDDATCVLPVIPVQRAGVPSTESTVPPYVPAQPSGPPPSGPPPLGYGAVKAPSVYPPARTADGPASPAPTSSAPRRRVRPAVLAGVTAVLLVAGVAVGVSGVADPAQEPGTSATP